MINTFRKNQRILMTVIAAVTIISFVWFFNPGQRSGGRFNEGDGGIKIYDRVVPQADIEREVKNYVLARALGQYDMMAALGGTADDENMAVTEFVFNLLVARHQAAELGVAPTQLQAAERLQALPAFRTNGQYDPLKFNKFVEENLGPQGLTVDRLYSAVIDAITVERLRDIVGSPMAVSPLELADAARILQKMDIEIVRFPAAVAGVTVSDDEIKLAYEQNQQAFVAPETRSVQYVEFASPDPLPQDPKAKIEVQQKLADTADAFAKKAAAGSFEQAASAENLTVKTSDELDRSGLPSNPAGRTGVEERKEMAAAAFLLTPEKPVSDVVQSGDRFYVLKLANVTPQKLRTLEEVRPMIEARLQTMKARQQGEEAAKAALAALRQAIAGGKSFADAAKDAGLKTEAIKGLDLGDQSATPEQRQFAGATMLMQPGQLSGLVPSMNGAAAVYLVARQPADPAKLKEQEPEIKAAILENKQQILFGNWLASARAEAKITQPQAPQRQR